jgi:D-lactate dehydrogenase
VKVTVFSAKGYDRATLTAANERHGHALEFLDVRLDTRTAALAAGADAVCVFVNDTVDAATLERLGACGVRAVALRCAGFNNVDVDAAHRLGVVVVRVPAYSPESVAEHTLAMILSLDRSIHRAHQRVREGNFSLEGLLAHGLHGSTAGVVGTGRVGARVARLLLAFGCHVLVADPYEDAALAAAGAVYVPRDELLARATIIALTCPLTPETFHMIDAAAVARMTPGVMLVNTGRGALIDTAAVVAGLKSGRIGSVGLDVYEEEAALFFEDRSAQIIADDVYARLMTFPNVLLTAHQAFFSRPALEAIAETTLANLDRIERDQPAENAL